VKKTGRRALRMVDRFIGNRSLVGDHPFFDPVQFPFIESLEKHWGPIRAELERLLEARDHIPAFHEVSPDQKRISKDDHWKTFILYGFGRKAERNCRQCPQTTRVLETIPHLQTAMFSIVAPGYHIPPHRGVTKGVIRIHLGLIVPKRSEQCFIRVGDQVRHWEEGKCIVLDDTYDHEVWNNTEELRVVLFIDVERPLPLAGRLLNKGLLKAVRWTAYFKDARANLQDWETRFEAAVRKADSFAVDSDGPSERPLGDKGATPGPIRR
jgi:beta-hydroxylase